MSTFAGGALATQDNAERFRWTKSSWRDGLGTNTRAGADPSVIGQRRTKSIDYAIVAEQAAAAQTISSSRVKLALK
jgi:hypothetical protein